MNNEELNKQLHKLVHRGCMDEARQILELAIMEDPNNKEAANELDRLNKGIRLHAAETPHQRRNREANTLLRAFRKDAQEAAKKLPLLTSDAIRRRIRNVEHAIINPPPEWKEQDIPPLREYRKVLKKQLAKNQHSRVFWLTTSAVLGVFLLFGFILFLLHGRAELALDRVNYALHEGKHETLQLEISRAEQTLYTLLNPSLQGKMKEAKDWLEQEKRAQETLKKLLHDIQKGVQAHNELNPSQIALLRSARHSKDASWAPLAKQWAEIQRHHALLAKKNQEQVVEELLSPIEKTPLIGSREEVAEQLLKEKALIQDKLERFMQEELYLALPSELMAHFRERLATIDTILTDCRRIDSLNKKLTQITSYQQYRRDMLAHRAIEYKSAHYITRIAANLPSEDDLRELEHARSKDPALHKAIRKTIIDSGPSFTTEFPAISQQVSLIFNLLSNQVLHTFHWIVYDEKGTDSWISIKQPQIDVEKNTMTIELAPADPNYRLNSNNERQVFGISSLIVRRVDSSGILAASQLNQASFFRDAQMANTLDEIVNYQSPTCPALLKAYLYKNILEVMNLHKTPNLMGFAYSPRLRADAKSFKNLCQKCGVRVEDECWLRSDKEHRAAEELWRSWFQNRGHRRYAPEMARNLRSLVLERPQFVGYITEHGSMHLLHPLAENSVLWYLDDENFQLKASPMGEIESAAPYSPLFAVEKKK